MEHRWSEMSDSELESYRNKREADAAIFDRAGDHGLGRQAWWDAESADQELRRRRIAAAKRAAEE